MYCSLWRIVNRLLSAYGGFSAFALSPYVHLSFLISIVFSFFGESIEIDTLTLQIIPSILGFSIGAYAIMFSAIGERILEIISRRDSDELHSPLSELSAAFGYYVLVQATAVILAAISMMFNFFEILVILIPGASDYQLTWIFLMEFLKSFVFIYSLLLSIALALEIFRVSTLREE